MDQNNQKPVEKVATLTALLNQYRHEYYNLNAPTVDDEVYDRLFDILQKLEQSTGIRMTAHADGGLPGG